MGKHKKFTPAQVMEIRGLIAAGYTQVAISAQVGMCQTGISAVKRREVWKRPMTEKIVIVCNSRAEAGPLESVIAALPEARVVTYTARGEPSLEMSRALRFFNVTLEGAKLVIVLGDRYETLAAALAAMFLRIPVAHIHGGETTTGAFDDAMRHSVTQIARLHFVATSKAWDRVHDLRDGCLGPGDIHLVGAPGLDTIRPGCARRNRKMIVASYYPETMAEDRGLGNCRAMLDALQPYAKDHAIFFSSVNADPGAEEITRAIEAFIYQHPRAARWITPNTREQYLHLIEQAAVVVGNSSAGVIECPWIGVPSVNIGRRQEGREMAESVFNVANIYDGPLDLSASIQAAMTSRIACHPIYRGGAAEKIAAVCREFVK